MGIVGDVFGGAAGAVFDLAGKWVADGAVWLLGRVGGAMAATTTVDLGGSWFTGHERIVASMAAAVVLPMACCGLILAVARQDASMLVRSFLVKLPLALLLTGVSVELVRIGLAVTDQLSAQVLATGGTDTRSFLAPIASALTAGSVVSSVPAFVVFVGALLVAMGALVLWLELVVRDAAVAAAALFLPLALAALVWPAVSHWCRRLADTIAALVLSKLVIAAVLSLAAGALAGGITGTAGGGAGGDFAAVVTGIALLLLATAAPFVLLRLVPAVEAGAVLHLEAARHRLQSTAMAPVNTGRSLALAMAGSAGMLGAGTAAGSGAAAGAGAGIGVTEAPTTGVGAIGGGSDEHGEIPMLHGEPGGWERFAEEMAQRQFRPMRARHDDDASAPAASPTEAARRATGAEGTGAGQADDR